MIPFFIGLTIGGCLGVCLMACLSVASHEDDLMEKYEDNITNKQN